MIGRNCSPGTSPRNFFQVAAEIDGYAGLSAARGRIHAPWQHFQDGKEIAGLFTGIMSPLFGRQKFAYLTT
jgi:hypothetical protein